MLDGRAPAPLCRRPASATSSTGHPGRCAALDRRRDARSRGAVPQGSSVTPSSPRVAVAVERRLHLRQPTRTRPRRPRSQSLSNDHTWTVATEVPRRGVEACPGGPSHSPAAPTHGVERVSHDLVASDTHTEVRSFGRLRSTWPLTGLDKRGSVCIRKTSAPHSRAGPSVSSS